VGTWPQQVGGRQDDIRAAPSRLPGFAPPALDIRHLGGGEIALRSPIPFPDHVELLTARMREWASSRPLHPMIAERSPDGWNSVAYGHAWDRTGAIAEGLLSLGLGADRPLLIGGEPSVDQALLRLAALRAGVPFVPLSPALFRHGAHERLKQIAGIVQPGLLVLSRACLDACSPDLWAGEVETRVFGAPSFDALAKAGRSRLPAAEREIGLDDLAAVFLTSGSTGMPKMVMVTQRMISANQIGYELVWPWLTEDPPVILDWLPWHHTFGGNDNLHKAIWHGGTYHIDDGQPADPQGVARTVRNIIDIAPTVHLNVPKGLGAVVGMLESDAQFRARFFERLRVIFFAGAGLSPHIWSRLGKLVAEANEARPHPVALVSGYGSTETGSTVSLVHFDIDRPHLVGLPLPGLDLRLVPEGDKTELRVRGANVTPGYWKDPERTAAAFDAQGYFRTGDAMKLTPHDDPVISLIFDGRVADDFKLSNGSWVSVGPLRLALLARLGDAANDILVATDGDRLGLVVMGSHDPAALTRITSALRAHNAASPASTTRIARAICDARPLSSALGEINDKGQANMRLALQNRAPLVADLFADPVRAGVIDLTQDGRKTP
jgi:feruloyl-CoA synthase